MMTIEDMLRCAYKEAQRSKDLSTQNGAIIYNPRRDKVIAWGWNELPPLVRDLPDRRMRPLKYAFTEHAERAAIFDAACHGAATGNCWLIAGWLACTDCARAIICSGITKVIRHKIPQHSLRPDWKVSIARADIMLKEAGVEIHEYEGFLNVKFRFDGQIIEV